MTHVHEFAPNSNPSHDRILRPRELAGYVGLSLATLWRLRRTQSLPEPIRLSKNCVGWRISVIDAWLATRNHAA